MKQRSYYCTLDPHKILILNSVERQTHLTRRGGLGGVLSREVWCLWTFRRDSGFSCCGLKPRYAVVCKSAVTLMSNRLAFKSPKLPDVWFTSTLTVLAWMIRYSSCCSKIDRCPQNDPSSFFGINFLSMKTISIFFLYAHPLIVLNSLYPLSPRFVHSCFELNYINLIKMLACQCLCSDVMEVYLPCSTM